MNRRLLFLGGAVVLLLVLGIVVFGLRRSSTNTNGFDVNAFGRNANATANTNAGSTKQEEALKIRSLAVIFSERYASGPVSSTNQRLSELAELLTPNLTVFAQGQAARPAVPVDPERVVAGKALTVASKSQTDKRATVDVTLQLSESIPKSPTEAPTVTYRTLHLGLQKVAADWKVAEVSWGERITL